MVNLDKKEAEYLISILKTAPDSPMNKKLLARIENSVRTIQPRSAKRKGLDWQKECCEMISRATGIPYAQNDDACEIHSRESARSGVDIVLRGEAARQFSWKVECKNARSVSLPAWIRQARTNSGEENDWLLLIKSTALPGKKIAVMDFTRFEQIATLLCATQRK